MLSNYGRCHTLFSMGSQFHVVYWNELDKQLACDTLLDYVDFFLFFNYFELANYFKGIRL